MDYNYAYKLSDVAHRGQTQANRFPRFKQIVITSLTTGFFIWCFFWFKSNFDRLSQELEDDKRITEASHHFREFLAQFGKSYSDPEEYLWREGNYTQNFLMVRHQSGSSLMRLNHMADWTDEEYEGILGIHHLRSDTPSKNIPSHLKDDLQPVNWVKTGAVSSVKDRSKEKQRYTGKNIFCASSYATVTAEAIEGAYYVETKRAKKFSVQQIVDCSSNFDIMSRVGEQVNYGCEGGFLASAFAYAQTHPIYEESEYPWSGQ